MATDNINRLKSIRTAYKGHCTRNKDVAEGIMISETPDVNELENLVEAMSMRMEKITAIDQQILSEVEEAQIETEVERSMNYEETWVKFKNRVTNLVAQNRKPTTTTPATPTVVENRDGIVPVNSRNRHYAKLPKMKVRDFSGDPLEWLSFWDSFESAVDKDSEMNDVDKMNYLKSFLKGDALRAIEGLTLTNGNYAISVDLLKKRFGKKQMIISAYMDAVMKLPYATNDVKKLRRFYDTLEAYVRGLEALQVTSDSYGCLLMPVLLKKIPDELKRVILRSSTDPTMDEMKSLLCKEIEVREIAAMSSDVRSNYEDVRKRDDFNSTAGAMLFPSSMQEGSMNCVFCGKTHLSEKCTVAGSIDRRVQILRKQGRCFNCLRKNHMLRACLVKHRCQKCNGKHHISICRKENEKVDHNARQRNDADKEKDAREKKEVTPELSSTCSTPGRNIILQSASVCVKSSRVRRKTRLIFDTGAQRTFMTKQLAEKLRCVPICNEVLSVSSFGDANPHTSEFTLVSVELESPEENFAVEALVVDSISAPIPMKVPKEWLKQPLLEGLKLADDYEDDVLQVEMIIGNDYYGSLINGKIIKDKGVMMLESKFGWLLSGPISHGGNVSMQQVSCFNVNAVISNETLDARLQTFWEISSCEDEDQKSDDTMKTFEETIKFDSKEERYIVKLPWKETDKVLPTNYAMCKNRLKSLVKKLRKMGRLKEYDDILKDQVENKFIEEVKYSKSSFPVHYLPHFAVIRDDSETTKLRIVYDPSTTLGDRYPCLNDLLHKGPSLLPLMTSILRRFRLFPVAMIADIEKAFLQILLAEEDRDVTRFLWLIDIAGDVIDDNLVCLRFRRVLFGPSPSPFLMNATIQHHLNTYDESDRVAAQLKTSLYSDNLVSGAENEENAVHFYTHSKDVFEAAGMKLRGWVTNSKELEETFVDEKTPDGDTKVLGLSWNTAEDVLRIPVEKMKIDVNDLKKLTKRTVCGIAARLFDPLGLIEPFTVRAKMMMQELWMKKIGWDDEIPFSESASWNKWIAELEEVGDYVSKRRYFDCKMNEVQNAELHVFCDSSKKAYGAVCYLRVEKDDDVYIQHVTSKSKVAPIKGQSIPRLEFLAALLGCTVLKKVMESLNDIQKISSVVCWADSQIVLHWIQGRGLPDPWIKRRLPNIKRDAQMACWRYCPSKLNPADVITRGSTMRSLIEDKWTDGPSWLRKVEEWPCISICDADVGEECVEKIDVTQNMKLVSDVGSISKIIDMQKFSSLSKLLRVTAYVLRFVNNCRSRKKRCGELDVNERDDVMRKWVKDVQAENLDDEIKWCKKGKDVPPPTLVKQLNLFLDEERVLRCKGRIENALLPNDVRFPVLLPKVHLFTTLVILKAHDDVFHAGVRETLAEVRQKFWVPQGRRVVKSRIRGCVTCRKVHGKPYQGNDFPPLPKLRISEGLPFQYTGVDFAGPLFMKEKDGKTTKKVYVCLFTCAVVRAVHLEVVEDLSVQAFLRAFRRFFSRRGVPEMMISDNAKNFKGAAEEIRFHSSQIMKTAEAQKFLFNKGIKWNFIVPRAAWWGGFYERMIGMFKRSLKKSAGRSLLFFEDLVTIVTEIEAVINSRPLTYLYSDIEEGSPLTPSHFLCGKRLLNIPECQKDEDERDDPDFTPDSTKRGISKSLRIRNANMKSFWSCWRKEYLVNLREYDQVKRKIGKSEKNPEVGDVVLLGDQTPRSQWRLAKIIELIPGKDGVVRAVHIRTSSGTILQRAIQHLYPLEVHDDEIDDNDDVMRKDLMNDDSDDNNPVLSASRPPRQAAIEASRRIRENPDGFVAGGC